MKYYNHIFVIAIVSLLLLCCDLIIAGLELRSFIRTLERKYHPHIFVHPYEAYQEFPSHSSESPSP